MNRRNFLKSGSLAGLAFTGIPVLSCTNENSDKDQENKANAADNFELNESTIEGLQKQMADGKYSSHSLCKLYIDRINNIDKNGPKLNSIIELNPDALSIADAMDNERKKGKIRGPLHGIPVLIKDNIDTADKMQTTAGSLALEGNRASKDSFVAQRLRE
ncbi:MAG: amidase family protein, partial [Candidatus Dadabacteria bacterium]